MTSIQSNWHFDNSDRFARAKSNVHPNHPAMLHGTHFNLQPKMSRIFSLGHWMEHIDSMYARIIFYIRKNDQSIYSAVSLIGIHFVAMSINHFFYCISHKINMFRIRNLSNSGHGPHWMAFEFKCLSASCAFSKKLQLILTARVSIRSCHSNWFREYVCAQLPRVKKSTCLNVSRICHAEWQVTWIDWPLAGIRIQRFFFFFFSFFQYSVEVFGQIGDSRWLECYGISNKINCYLNNIWLSRLFLLRLARIRAHSRISMGFKANRHWFGMSTCFKSASRHFTSAIFCYISCGIFTNRCRIWRK